MDKKSLKIVDKNLAKKNSKLPSWVKRKLKKSKLTGKSGKVIQLNSGKKYHIGNPLNDLSGSEWTHFLRSVFSSRYPTSGKESYGHKIRKIHPSPKPPQLMRELIEFFTKENEFILDYFMGVGGTLLGASLSGRKAIGIDIQNKFISAYKKCSKSLNLELQHTLQGDCFKYLNSQDELNKILNNKKISLIAIDPPYGDMMSRKKTGEAINRKGSEEATPFSNKKNDLGNMDRISFLENLKKSVQLSSNLLKHKGHVIIFAKDFQPDGKNANLLHAEIIKKINEIENIDYIGMKIWADESINLYPYGYPYAFVPNQLHQYIMVFKKKN